jgi:hypothetical protein
VDKSLKRYIQMSLEKGYTIGMIEVDLAQAGYSDKQIKKALTEFPRKTVIADDLTIIIIAICILIAGSLLITQYMKDEEMEFYLLDLEYGENIKIPADGIESISDYENFWLNDGVIENSKKLGLGSYSLIFDNKHYQITVSDTKPPEWKSITSNVFIAHGDKFTYRIEATDEQEITYTLSDYSNFMLENGLISSTTTLPLGMNRLEVTATDLSGNSIKKEITITAR